MQPMSQPQPLKPQGVVGHSSVPALGVLTQGSDSSLGGGRAYLDVLLAPAAIMGCRGWGAHPIFQAARGWVGPSPFVLHQGNDAPCYHSSGPLCQRAACKLVFFSVCLKTVTEC